MTKENDTEVLDDDEQRQSENEEDGTVSFLTLDDDYDKERTYSCVANNSVGIGTMCSIKVEGTFSFAICAFSTWFTIR